MIPRSAAFIVTEMICSHVRVRGLSHHNYITSVHSPYTKRSLTMAKEVIVMFCPNCEHQRTLDEMT